MDYGIRLAVFQAQVINVRELEKADKQIHRAVNHAIRRGDVLAIDTLTRVDGLVFCAWSEAMFSKLVHTPYGFELSEVEQIKQVHARDGLEHAWLKAIELGLSHAAVARKYRANWLQRLSRVAAEFVADPRHLRNKIAHGQWTIALNRANTAVNAELTKSLKVLDDIQIRRWFVCFRHLAECLRVLIESPEGKFHRDAELAIADLESVNNRTATWTMHSLAVELRRKPIGTVEAG